MFEITDKDADQNYNGQRFYLKVKYNPAIISGAPIEQHLFKIKTMDPKNYILCQNVHYLQGSGRGWDVGLYTDAKYECWLQPLSIAPEGIDVEFSFPFAPKQQMKLGFDIEFAVTINDVTYDQTITDLTVTCHP